MVCLSVASVGSLVGWDGTIAVASWYANAFRIRYVSSSPRKRVPLKNASPTVTYL
jgi:hypothetical protein